MEEGERREEKRREGGEREGREEGENAPSIYLLLLFTATTTIAELTRLTTRMPWHLAYPNPRTNHPLRDTEPVHALFRPKGRPDKGLRMPWESWEERLPDNHRIEDCIVLYCTIGRTG